MRKKIIAGNWKMKKTYHESKILVTEIVKNLKKDIISKVDVVICPSFTSLSRISKILKESKISLGAQNMHFENEGAYTGEISASMVKALNCKYVILGHSERRQYFAETDEIINLKIKKAIENKLISIVCVGEFLEQRQNNIQTEVVNRQLTKCLEGVKEENLKYIVVAYEPVWAIGTGKTATPDQANYMHIAIRETLESLYNKERRKGNSSLWWKC